MKFIKRLILVFRYGDEIDELLKDKRNTKDMAERESRKHNLDLCYEHRQERNRSQYSPHNCDYCKLLKGLPK